MPEFSLASLNMRRRNTFMHALLNTNTSDDILFVQECYVTAGTFARRGLSLTAKTLRSLSDVRGSEY